MNQKNTPSVTSNSDEAEPTKVKPLPLPSRAVVTPVRAPVEIDAPAGIEEEDPDPVEPVEHAEDVTPVISKPKSFQPPAVQKSVAGAKEVGGSKKGAKEGQAEKKEKKMERKQKAKKNEKAEKEDPASQNKKSKPAKDPNAPKGAKGCYLYFQSHMRPGKMTIFC